MDKIQFKANLKKRNWKALVSGDSSLRIELELCGGEDEQIEIDKLLADIKAVDTIEVKIKNG